MSQFYRPKEDILRCLAARRVRVEQVAIAVESAQRLVPKKVAGRIHTQRGVPPFNIGVKVRNRVPIFADNDDVPWTIHVFGRAEVVNGSLSAFLIVEADGILHERLCVGCRLVLRGDGNATGDEEREVNPERTGGNFQLKLREA